MDKELMIQKLMREIEMDFSFDLRLGLIDRIKFNDVMKSERNSSGKEAIAKLNGCFSGRRHKRI